MNKKYLWIIGCIALLLCALNAQAVYFTIQLHNGKEMTTEKYWEEGDKISFFTRGGTLALPKSTIKNILKNDGDLGTESVYFSTDFLSGLSDDEKLAKLGDIKDDEQLAERIEDIKDRISIIDANIENLERNKQTYMKQRENYEQNKQKSRDKIAALQSDSFITSKDLAERTELEESKITDADIKIKKVNEQIRNNAKMIEKQTNMKRRLEQDLQEAGKKESGE